MRRLGQFLLLALMVFIIGLGCLQTAAVQGEAEEKDPENVTITLYFIDDSLEGLFAEERSLQVEDESWLPACIVEEALKGPLDAGLRPVIPAGTRLLGIRVEKGRATVNLSGEVREKFNLGAMGEGYVIFSLVNALTELSHIREVQFLVEGEVIESIGGHFLLKEPFTRDESLIKER
jgi:germination protein M